MREVAAALRDVPGVANIESEATATEGTFCLHIECRPGRDARPQLAAAVVQRRWELLEMQALGLSLEDIFLRLTTHEEHDEHA